MGELIAGSIHFFDRYRYSSPCSVIVSNQENKRKTEQGLQGVEISWDSGNPVRIWLCSVYLCGLY
jgi:hypothetical protein